MEEKKIKKIFFINKTLLEMLKDRNYNINIEIKNFDGFKKENLNKNKKEIYEKLSYIFEKEKTKEKIKIFFCLNLQKINESNINEFKVELDKEKIKRCIIIIKNNKRDLTLNTKKKIEQLNKEKYIFEIFKNIELFTNITNSKLVSKHRILTNEEVLDLLKKYSITIDQLPIISISDPMAKYHGMEDGQICEIERESETSGKTLFYRLCKNQIK